MDAEPLIKHEFDLRYSRIVEDLKAERCNGKVPLVELVPDEEREQIAEKILAELWPPVLAEYEDILRAQEIYEKLERQE